MLRIIRKQTMRRDANLCRIEMVDANRANIIALAGWCSTNRVMYNHLNDTSHLAGIVIICTLEQLSFIIMKFGGGND